MFRPELRYSQISLSDGCFVHSVIPKGGLWYEGETITYQPPLPKRIEQLYDSSALSGITTINMIQYPEVKYITININISKS